MSSEGEALLRGNSMHKPFELRGVDVDQCGTAGALQVMMVWSIGTGEFVALFPADVDNLDNAQPMK